MSRFATGQNILFSIVNASRLPFLVVAIILGVATICAVAVRFSERLPINPWEAAIAIEAMRLNAGLPLYESGHATHMYGPLLTVMLAGVFRFTGLNLLAARIVLSVFAFVLVLVLSNILCRGKSRGHWLLAFVLFLGINFRTNLVFLSAQPDCAAAFFAVLALWLWITREKSWVRSIISIAFFLCALLLKQTSAAFALIPLVYVLLWKRPLRFSDLAISLVPAFSIALALSAIRLLWPQMFWAIVTIPASIKVYYGRALPITIYLLATFPIFVIALLASLRSRDRIDERERWVWSAIVVLVPVSIWTICKSGGSYNSLLFAYLAMTALFVVKFGVVADWIASLPTWRSFAAATLIAAAVLCSFFLQFDRACALLLTRCGDEKYDAAVALARRLGPGVVSPQDPTIAYRANGSFGRSLYFELDAQAVNGNWPNDLPDSMQQELARAEYVVQVTNYVPTPVFERGLEASLFHPVGVPELRGSAYTLWMKNRRLAATKR
jgi:hypothetical protein